MGVWLKKVSFTSGRLAARMIERPEVSAYKSSTWPSVASSSLIALAGIAFSPAFGRSRLLLVEAALAGLVPAAFG